MAFMIKDKAHFELWIIWLLHAFFENEILVGLTTTLEMPFNIEQMWQEKVKNWKETDYFFE